jgi:glycosyltransferase involved in cell wall biosynthesis
MKILTLVDKKGSAIWTLAKSVQKHAKHFDIIVQDFHPKRPSIDQLEVTPGLLEEADLIDVQYWKTGEKVKELYPDIWHKKKKILTHHNPYDLHKLDWKDYIKVVVTNDEQQVSLPNATKIPLGIDLDFYEYNEELTEDKTVMMCVARIEGKKGVREVAQACKELKYKFILIGRISNGKYMDEVKEASGEYLEFHENVSEEEKLELYKRSGLHICNSIDGFETGTMPILESMAVGVPVLTRSVGHVPELFNGKNMIIRQGLPNDVELLKSEIKEIMENHPRREKIREYAWDTAKLWGDKRMARRFSSLFYSVLSEDPLISIIIPTYNRGENLIESIAGAVGQTYESKEVVVVDSGSESAETIVNEFMNHTKVPIKYIRFEREGYTLAEARNRGVIEAEGEVLVFCDDRLKMEPNAVEVFANVMSNQWWWGSKGGYRKGFVENFSAVQRETLIKYGMFCERMDRYGGMTQEVRTRFEKNGVNFVGIDGVNANQIVSTKGKHSRRKDIIASKLKLFKMYGG